MALPFALDECALRLTGAPGANYHTTPMSAQTEPKEMTQEEQQLFREFLKGKNLHFTRQRQEILEKVLATPEHFSVESLLDWARSRARPIGRVTLYRTLALLVECNLVEERDFRQGRKYYERVYGQGHHEHLICLDCGTVSEVRVQAISRLKDRLSRESGFRPEYHDLRIFGYCLPCAEKRQVVGPGVLR